MYPYLVADIGGTNARFALVTGSANHDFTLEHIHILKASDYSSFEAALQAYIELTGNIHPKAACIAIAGPVTGDRVKMTNLSWEFSCAEIEAKFNLDRFVAINDFAAVAAACGHLSEDHLFTVKPGHSQEHASRAVFGPGTGLGVAGLIHHANRWIPVPCEGGHINIAPSNDLEADIIKTALQKQDHISAEWFISGPGLVNLYTTICQLNGVTPESLSPADITSEALANGNQQCVDTLHSFCSFAGAFAGNLALTFGAKGGVYIAGGIFPRFKDFLVNSQFSQRFTHKGVMSHFVESIPVYLINHTETAFVGAAATLEQEL